MGPPIERKDTPKKQNDKERRQTKTVMFLFQLIDQMQSNVQHKMDWVTSIVGTTGRNVRTLTVFAMHFGFFLVATFCLVFVNAPVLPRTVLLVIVPLDAWGEVTWQWSLTYAGMTSLLFFTVVGKSANKTTIFHCSSSWC